MTTFFPVHVEPSRLSEEEAMALMASATDAMANAYVEYSHFPVGAALLTASGVVVTGVNVENISYGLTICAERTALVKAISEGHRQFKAIAVCAANPPHQSVTPCGACRQFIREFFQPNTPIIMRHPEDGRLVQVAAADILPGAFDKIY